MKFKKADIAVAVYILAAFMMLIVPIPNWMLDFFLAVNIAMAFSILFVTMFVKAVSFGAQYIAAGNPVSGGLCLAAGGTLFFSSDLTLVLLMFNEKMKKNHRLKDYNIGSYFLGQTLLALSVLSIGLI